jgi:hypothetical protein
MSSDLQSHPSAAPSSGAPTSLPPSFLHSSPSPMALTGHSSFYGSTPPVALGSHTTAFTSQRFPLNSSVRSSAPPASHYVPPKPLEEAPKAPRMDYIPPPPKEAAPQLYIQPIEPFTPPTIVSNPHRAAAINQLAFMNAQKQQQLIEVQTQIAMLKQQKEQAIAAKKTGKAAPVQNNDQYGQGQGNMDQQAPWQPNPNEAQGQMFGQANEYSNGYAQADYGQGYDQNQGNLNYPPVDQGQSYDGEGQYQQEQYYDPYQYQGDPNQPPVYYPEGNAYNQDPYYGGYDQGQGDHNQYPPAPDYQSQWQNGQDQNYQGYQTNPPPYGDPSQQQWDYNEQRELSPSQAYNPNVEFLQ